MSKPRAHTIRQLRAKYDKLLAHQKATEAKIVEAQIAMQRTCKHPDEQVIEGRYKPEGYIVGAEPPFRVCKICGLAERGWQCYKKLRRKDPTREYSHDNQVDRDYALTFVIGAYP